MLHTLSIVVSTLILATFYDQTVGGHPSADFSKTSGTTVFPGSWVSDIFYETLANFTVRDLGSTACRIQTDMYDRNLRNYTSWAVRMAESWDRRPIGVLEGNRYHLGIYDECVQVNYPVRGQYCLAEIKLIPPTGKNYSYERTKYKDYFGNNHAWHTVLGWIDYPDQIPRNILNVGVCIPDSCTASDLQKSLQKEFDRVIISEQARAIVKVDPTLCTVNEDNFPYNTAYYVTSAVFLLLVFICCLATLHHIFILSSYEQNKNEISNDCDSIFHSFTCIRSIQELIQYDKNDKLNAFNGSKCVIMILILFGHRLVLIGSYPMSYRTLEDLYIYGPDILLTASNTVDPFLFMSGYLLYITTSSKFKNQKSALINILSSIFRRIIRILPAYCAVIAIVVHIAPHLGDGPFWSQKMSIEAEICKKYWWANLLFINNYMDINNQCLLMSWYISCDVQLFIIGVIITCVYVNNNKIGIRLLITMLCVSIFTPFIITLLKKGEGLLIMNLLFFENPRNSKTVDEFYRPSYMRAIPFLSGLACIIAVKRLKEKKIKLSQITVHGGTLIMFGICFCTQFYGIVFYERNRPYFALEHALFSSLGHCAMSVLCAWICICLFTTGYGVLLYPITNRFVVTLGKLSYSVFLINFTVMMMSQYSQRLPIYPSVKTLLDTWIYDVFKTYLMATALYLVVEAPFKNLTKKIFERRGRVNIIHI